MSKKGGTGRPSAGGGRYEVYLETDAEATVPGHHLARSTMYKLVLTYLSLASHTPLTLFALEGCGSRDYTYLRLCGSQGSGCDPTERELVQEAERNTGLSGR